MNNHFRFSVKNYIYMIHRNIFMKIIVNGGENHKDRISPASIFVAVLGKKTKKLQFYCLSFFSFSKVSVSLNMSHLALAFLQAIYHSAILQCHRVQLSDAGYYLERFSCNESTLIQLTSNKFSRNLLYNLQPFYPMTFSCRRKA